MAQPGKLRPLLYPNHLDRPLFRRPAFPQTDANNPSNSPEGKEALRARLRVLD